MYPKNTAAEIPPAVAVNPPVKTPINPSFSTAFITPWAREFPKPKRGIVAPAPPISINFL